MTQKISPFIIDIAGIPSGAYLQNVMGVAQWATLQVNLASQIAGKLPLSAIDTTGTASTLTFLRGDGTWATPTDLDIEATWGGIAGNIADQSDLIDLLSDFQSINTTLTALSNLNASAGIIEQTGADTFAKRAIGVSTSASLLTRADGDGRYSASNHTHTLQSLGFGLGSAASANSSDFATAEHTHTNQSLGLGTAALSNAVDFAEAVHAHAISQITGLNAALDAKENTVTAGTTSQYYRGDKTWATLNKASVALSNVDNTSDTNKPVSNATQTALDQKLDAAHEGLGGTAHATVIASGAAGFMSGADKSKLDGIETGATANSSDVSLKNRSNHTGTQSFSTVTMSSNRILGRISSGSGVAEEIEVSAGLLLAAGAITLAASISDISGLQNALDAKLTASLVSNFALNLLNDTTAAEMRTTLGLGSAALQSSATFAVASHTHAMTDISGLTAALLAKEPTITSGTTTQFLRGDKTWVSIDKDRVGLNNVDNTTDTNKPISSAAQTALNAKAPIANPIFTGTVTLASNPVSALQAATKQYVDNVAQGIGVKPSVIVSTGSDITLSGEQTIDGVLTSGSRVLVKNQTNAADNGIYVTSSGAWTRSVDMDVWSEFPSAFVFVENGSARSGTGWVCITPSNGTLGISAVAWSQFSGAGTYTASGGIIKAGSNFVLAEMPAFTIKGNSTGSTAVPSDLSVAQVTALLNIFTTSLKGLVPASGGGTSNYLRADGTWAAPIASVWGSLWGTLTDQSDLASALNGKEPTIVSGTNSQFWRGDKQWVGLTKTTVGLANVDNTADIDKPISTATQTALGNKLDTSHVGTGGSAHAAATTSVSGFMSSADKSKLDGIASNATSNLTNSALLTRANHNGSQDLATINSSGTGIAGRETGASSLTMMTIGSGISLSSGILSLGSHTHVLSDVTGLQTALDAKQSTNATLTALMNLTSTAGILEQTGASTFTKRSVGVGAGTHLLTRADGDGRYATLSHIHTISNIVSLQESLDTKLNTNALSVYGLSFVGTSNASSARTLLGLGSAATASVSDFPAISHTHTIANVTGLQAALDTKLNTSTLSSYGQTLITAATAVDTWAILQLGSAALANAGDFAASVHSHAWGSITGSLIAQTDLQTALNGKQAVDATLTALAGLNSSVGLLEQTGADVFTKRAIGVASSTDILTRGDGDTRYIAAGSVTKSSLGLGNVDNTSDINKPISTAVADALATKEPTISSGTTSQYLRGDKTWQTLNKAAVALSNVDNTSDANKPVSTATQTALNLKINTSQRGVPNGIAELDSSGKLVLGQFPTIALSSTSVVNSLSEQLALVADAGDIAIRTDTQVNYVHNGGTSGTIADWTQLASGASVTTVNGYTGTVSLTKSDIGLTNVDNTSDANKPISSATQTALNAKANSSHSHVIGDVTGLQTAIDAKANSSHTHIIGDVTGLQTALDGKLAIAGNGSQLTNLTKSQVGLANVDNTSDANKPISSATLASLNTKAPIANPTFTGTVTLALDPVSALQAATKQYVDTALGTMWFSIPNNTVLGNISGSSALPTTLTGTDITSILNAFTSALKGLVPASGGGTGKYLRSDGSWITLDKVAVGLSNVDNTADSAKPVSTATQTALNAKQALDATLTALAALDSTTGLLEQTGVDTFTKRVIGVANSSDILTRGDGDGRYATTAHSHVISDVTGLQTAIDAKISTSTAGTFGLSFLGSSTVAAATALLNTFSTSTKGLVPSPTTSTGRYLRDDGTWATVAASSTTFQGLNDAADYTVLDGNKVVKINASGTGLDFGVVLGSAASQNTSAFATASHTHVIADVTNLQTTLNSKLNSSVVSNFALTLLDDTSASSVRTTLELGTAAAADSAAFAEAIHTHTMSGVIGLVSALSGKEPTISSGSTSQYYRGDKTWQTLNKAAVGLSNVDNISDINKPVSTATQNALNLKANLNSPTFTGTVTLENDPSAALEAATKRYVDSVAQGLNVKRSVLVSTSANISLTGEQTIDGVLTSGSRVLVRAQTSSFENGIYVSAAGAWTRAADMDSWSETVSAFVFIEQGSLFSDTGWVCTTNSSGTLGSTAIIWSQFSGVGTYLSSGGVSLSGNTFSLSQMPQNTLKGNATGSTASPTDLTGTQVTALLDVASTSLKGLMSSSDKTKLDAISGTNTGDQTITLTGDIAGSGTGSFATTLATVNSNTGSFGSATTVPTFTVNGKGLITATGSVTITPAFSSITSRPTTLSGYGITDAASNTSQVFSGNISALNLSGTNTGDQTTVSGNAGSATVLQTGRTLAMTGDVAWTSPSFNGSGNITAAGTIQANVVDNAKLSQIATATFKGRATAGTGNVEDLTVSQVRTLLSISGTSSGTNTGDQTITLTGNVTGSGTDSFATTIASGVVTNTMLASVATATFKGRTTASTGAVEDLTTAQATALLDLASGSVKGLMSASDFSKLAGIASGATANTGTVTSVSVATANGISGSVATSTTTPAITLTLGAITPTTVVASGNISGANLSGTNTGDQTNVSGNAGSATVLQTGRTIAMTGDVTWTSPSFNGSGNVTAAGTLATVNSNVGTFGAAQSIPQFTVNAKGLITSATTVAIGNTVAYNVGTSGATVPLLNGSNTWSGQQTISTGNSTTSADVFRLMPTNYSTGNPGLFFSKSVTAMHWNVALWDGSSTAGQFNITTSTVNVSNILTVGTDVRAPIYYDSNNTSFWIDPGASTAANLNGGITFAAANPTLSASGFIQFPNGIYASGGTSYFETELQARGGIRNDTGASLNLAGGTAGWTLIQGSARSPIFYDSDDITYYLDANSGGSTTSVSARLRGPAFFGPNTSGRFLRIGGNGQASDEATVSASNGNLQVDSRNGNHLYLNQSSNGWTYIGVGGGHTEISQSMRTPITYDLNDTGYYTDLNNTSQIKDLVLYNGYQWIKAWNGSAASPGEYRDWPNPALTISNFGNFTSQTMLAFALPNDGDYFIGYSVWNFKLEQTANSTTSAGVNQMSFGGPGRLYLNPSTFTESAGSMRAPIFYDSEDTNYYADLQTNAYAGMRIRREIFIGPNSSSRFLRIGGNGQATDEATISASNGNLHIDSRNGSDIHCNFASSGWTYFNNGGGHSVINNSLRTPIVYDLNNTGYYCDPASGSNLFGTSFTSGGCFIGTNSSTADINNANETGALSVRNNGGSNPASISFHRTGSYAMNMGLSASNIFVIGGWSATANAFQMDGGGNLTMTGDVTAYSDITLKKNIKTIENALDKVSQMRGVTFERKDSGKVSSGVIAQEFEKVAPELVMDNTDGIKSVAYGNTIGYLIEAIKELKQQNEKLQKRVDDLEK